jgi:pimeloyl-ACP methyl ester carboxylesterase
VHRAVEVKHRLRYDGTLIVFAWPSEGNVLPTIASYVRDSVAATQAAPALTDLLTGLARSAETQRIHLVAHSMGARILITALDSIGGHTTGSVGGPRFAGVSFLAPDVDSADFKTAVPRLAARAQRVTLYATQGDRALGASPIVHQRFSKIIRSRRAGETFDEDRRALVQPDLETVGIPVRVWSLWDASIWGLRHALHTERTALYDLLWNAARDVRARCRAERGLLKPRTLPMTTNGGSMWELIDANEEQLHGSHHGPDCRLNWTSFAKLTLPLRRPSLWA